MYIIDFQKKIAFGTPKAILAAFLALFAYSCTPSLDPEPGTGSRGDFLPEGEAIRLVTVGNSLTAGMQSSGCFAEAMPFSFSQMLATRLGAEDFIQPEWSEEGSGSQQIMGQRVRQVFGGFDGTGSPVINWIPAGQQAPLNASLQRPYNNLGVPGAVVADLLDTSNFMARSQARSNPYYAQILRNNALGRSMLEQAIALNPNVLTVWLGNNDLLGYAAAGGTVAMNGPGTPPSPTAPEFFQLVFEQGFRALTDALPNARILVFTVPDILDNPFFKTVPWNGLAIPRQSLADSLSFLHAVAGLTFTVGQNPFVVADGAAQGGRRFATSTDRIILPALTAIQTQNVGSVIPLPDNLVLTAEEQAVTEAARRRYNDIIRQTAEQYQRVHLVDMAAVLERVMTQGYPTPGFTPITGAFIAGGLYSLDGLHLTSRGYGALTNEIIAFINSTFGANYGKVLLSNTPPLRVHR